MPTIAGEQTPDFGVQTPDLDQRSPGERRTIELRPRLAVCHRLAHCARLRGPNPRSRRAGTAPAAHPIGPPGPCRRPRRSPRVHGANIGQDCAGSRLRRRLAPHGSPRGWAPLGSAAGPAPRRTPPPGSRRTPSASRLRHRPRTVRRFRPASAGPRRVAPATRWARGTGASVPCHVRQRVAREAAGARRHPRRVVFGGVVRAPDRRERQRRLRRRVAGGGGVGTGRERAMGTSSGGAASIGEGGQPGPWYGRLSAS